MAGISYSIANLSPEMREFTLFVSNMNTKADQKKVVENVLLPRGGFIQQLPPVAGGATAKFIRAWAKEGASQKSIHKQATAAIARVELRFTAAGDLVAVARRSDWKELELTDAPDIPGPGGPGGG